MNLDIYTEILSLPSEIVVVLAETLEKRASNPEMIEIRNGYFEFLYGHVLDIGCGSGDTSALMVPNGGKWCRMGAELVPNGGRVTGIDISPVMVERARDRHEGLRFDVGDARDLPYLEDSFNCVVFDTVLCHIPNAQKAVSEAHRVLRPKGMMVVFEGDLEGAENIVHDTHVLDTLDFGGFRTLHKESRVFEGSYECSIWMVNHLLGFLGKEIPDHTPGTGSFTTLVMEKE